MPATPDWSEQIKQYSDEMRRLYQKSDPPPIEETEPAAVPPPTTTPPAPTEEPAPASPLTKETPAPTRFSPPPAPPFGNGEGGTAQEAAPSAVSSEEETDTGTLVVRLVSARGTIPVVGATVTVFRSEADGDRLLYIGETDENGSSPTWTLPTKDRALSLEPGTVSPFVNYTVQANAGGYIASQNEGVAIFGGVQTFQRVFMLPLPEPAAVFEDTLLITRPESPLSELN